MLPYLRWSAIWIAWVVVRRRGLLAVLSLRRDGREPIDLILLIFPFAVALYLISPYTFFTGSPRYLFALYPVFAVALAATATVAAEQISAKWPRQGARVALAFGGVLLVALGSVDTVTSDMHFLGGSRGYTTDLQLRQAVRFLQAQGDQYVYGEYWTAMPAYYFAAGTDLRIAAWDFGFRFADVLAAVNAAPRFAYVSTNRPGDYSADAVIAALNANAATYRVTRFGSATVVDQLSRQLRPNQLGLVKHK